ncbi:hypothetical protein M3689_05700 [Alkalihalophilus marmarensis]|uniref:hypothetical protein n=1 Tax=Alkalihalophilus marmarensis TaxID=521377 RepID=UPI00203C758D|nr:hypothetical protein [Alkalihalophilus marmarensis]MCM3488799.1 hypothetical protein [Alkalihalophilus marmarensis]
MAETNDPKLESLFKAHEKAIAQIKALDNRLDSLAPFDLAKLEYLYSQAERQAWRIAGHYKKLYKYHEGLAEIAQGQSYKEERIDGKKNSTDGQYLSRIAKGTELVMAADYEGDFLSWKGVASTYEGARNSLKDMIKAIAVEGGTQSA